MDVLGPLLAAAALAAVHVLSQRLRVLDGVPRSRMLSIAGGMAVAFVILRLLPALAEGQDTLEGEVRTTPLELLDHHVYALVLLSIVVYYGVDRLAFTSGSEVRPGEVPPRARPSSGSVWASSLR